MVVTTIYGVLRPLPAAPWALHRTVPRYFNAATVGGMKLTPFLNEEVFMLQWWWQHSKGRWLTQVTAGGAPHIQTPPLQSYP